MPDHGVMTERRTVRDLRRSNRSVVLTKLYRDGPLSRQEVSAATSLSQASVSNLVAELLEDGLVEEAGLVDSDGGRPIALLRVAPRYAYVVGVDVGETRVLTEIFDLSMTALARCEHPIVEPRPRPATVLGHVLDSVATVVAAAGVDRADLLGVGVAVSGVVEQPDDAVVYAQTLGWDAVPVGAMLRAGADLEILVDNGAKTLGQAEMWFGAGRGSRHAVVALVGSGVGAAVVADGASYRGAHSSAGEWGHTTVAVGGRVCRCGARGCLEAYVGGAAVVERFREANGGRPAPGADVESAFAAVLDAADAGSAAAAAVVDETVEFLGAGLGALVNLFNPERLVLGGWAGLALGARHLPRLREATARHALRRPLAQASIELCELGPDAVALGAATLPIAALLADGGRRGRRGSARDGRRIGAGSVPD
jgi:predicted NBD/HSP70 family sugar kinase